MVEKGVTIQHGVGVWRMGQSLRGTHGPFQTLVLTTFPQVGIPEKKCVLRADLLSEPDGGRTGLGEGLRGLSLASRAPEESREHPTLNFPGAHREERGLWSEQPSPSGQREDGLPSPDRR